MFKWFFQLLLQRQERQSEYELRCSVRNFASWLDRLFSQLVPDWVPIDQCFEIFPYHLSSNRAGLNIIPTKWPCGSFIGIEYRLGRMGQNGLSRWQVEACFVSASYVLFWASLTFLKPEYLSSVTPNRVDWPGSVGEGRAVNVKFHSGYPPYPEVMSSAKHPTN